MLQTLVLGQTAYRFHSYSGCHYMELPHVELNVQLSHRNSPQYRKLMYCTLLSLLSVQATLTFTR